jgi:acyl carrier protein
MRLALIQVADNIHHFIWSHHHLLMDGWSLPLIFKEVLALYEAFGRGHEPQLEMVYPYRNYITWLQQHDLSEAEAFWREMFKGFTTPITLAADSSGDSLSAQEEAYSEQQIALPETITATLHSLARQHGLTLNTLIQGAWALLLSRYSGEEDVVFGKTVSGRPATLAGVESMVGLFINTLPVRATVSCEDLLLPWLKNLQSQQFAMQQYEYTPLVQIQEWSEVPPGVPLFDSLLVYENYPVDVSLQVQNGSLEIRDVQFVGGRTGYPLTIVVDPGRELWLQFIYDRHHIDTSMINRFLDHFQTLLASIAANPEQPILSLAPLPQIKKLVTTQKRIQIESKTAFVAPRTPIEKTIAEIWTELLGLESVGIHENFFELGGHSLVAIQIVSRIRQALQVEVSLRSLFVKGLTVARLAGIVEEELINQADTQEIENILAELDSLSDSEVEALLASEQ